MPDKPKPVDIKHGVLAYDDGKPAPYLFFRDSHDDRFTLQSLPLNGFPNQFLVLTRLRDESYPMIWLTKERAKVLLNVLQNWLYLDELKP